MRTLRDSLMRTKVLIAATGLVALLPTVGLAQHVGGMTPEAMVLTPRVKSALIADKQLKSAHINVDTMQGAVVLRGKVHSTAQKQHAAAVAKKAMGGATSKYKLINQLQVVT